MRYQTLDRIKKKGAVYNLIMAGRDTGKSTAMTKELIDDYLKTGHLFLRLFRRLGASYEAAGSWFDEHTIGGKFDCGHEITFKDDCYYIDGKLFGFTAIISLAKNYRSKVYPPTLYTAVYDEYIGLTPDEYVDGEVSKFRAILTTAFRHRDRKVWLLGNNYNEDSKFNPFHTWLGIDIDRDGIKQGQIRVYASKRFKNPARIAFEYGKIAYQTEDEIPLGERVDGNEVATSGDFACVWNVFDMQERYGRGKMSFMRESMDCLYVSDGTGRFYFPVLNEDLQTVDWVMTWDRLDEYGKGGNLKEWETLMEYEDVLRETYGDEVFEQACDEAIPYQIGVPLYDNGNRYGENCQAFIDGLRMEYKGFTMMYCDGNIKRIVEDIIMKGKMDNV